MHALLLIIINSLILNWEDITATNRIPIHNSVVTCRHIAINSSASAPLNATKIAVKKASDVDLVRYWPEL